MRKYHLFVISLLVALTLVLPPATGSAAPAFAEGTPPPAGSSTAADAPDDVLVTADLPSNPKINPALNMAYRTWQQATAVSAAAGAADSASLAAQAAAVQAMTSNLQEQFDFQALGAGARVLVQTTDEAQELRAAGIRTESAIGDVIAAFVPFERLAEIAALPSVVRIEASQFQKPTNDAGTVDIRAPQVWAGFSGGTGSNAIVAVIDSGIDPYHPDFIRSNGTSRLRGMLDLSDPGDLNSDGYLDGSVYGGTEYTEAQITAGSASPGLFVDSSNNNLNIPDNSSTGVNSSVSVGQPVTVLAVAVDVLISHSRVGDVKITLVCPSGTSVVLRDRVAGNGEATEIAGTYKTTACNGQSANGNWRLNVADLASTQTGYLAFWNLHLNQTVRMTDLVGHGTHVMGSAAGNGRATGGGLAAGTFKGVAPDAELLAVRATTNFGGSFSDNDIVNSLTWVDQKAQALGRPYVANLSLGGQVGAHDGTSLMERAVDNLVGTGKRGKAVVISAGNDGDLDIHAAGQVAQGQRREVKFSVPSAPAGYYSVVLLDIWYKGSDSFGLGYRRPDGNVRDRTVDPGQSTCYAPSNYAYMICLDSATNAPANGDKEVMVQLYALSSYAGTWTLFLHGDTVNNGRFDGWLLGGYNAKWASDVQRNMRVGMPGTARNAITVGAYTTKNQWLDIDGLVRTTSDQIGQRAYFSSDGPTRDGRLKPEISAPGQMIASSLSKQALPGASNSMYARSDIVQDSFHAVAQGTSMAAPHVTGAAALLLSINSCLDSAQLKEALTSTARLDQFTTGAKNNLWGYGKLDAFAGAGAVMPFMKVGSSSKVIISATGDNLAVTYGNWCAPQTMTVTLSGAAVFKDGSTSASRSLSTGAGTQGFAMRPKAGAGIGQAFTMTVQIGSLQLNLTGEIGRPVFLPLVAK